MKGKTKELLMLKLRQWEHSVWWGHCLEIIPAAVDAHINERYYLSIPALLPQIEGIIADGFGHRGQMGGRRLEKYISALLTDDELYSSYNSIVKVFLDNVVLVSFEHGGAINLSLSRHAILHGADVNYGTPENFFESNSSF